MHKIMNTYLPHGRMVWFVAFGVLVCAGIASVVYAATNTYSSQEAESATRSGNVALVSDSSASGSSAVKFGTTQTANCVGAANEPGGPDPWGGCWPGPQNTGYPHGLPGDTRTPVTLTNYTGPYTLRTSNSSCGLVIDSKILNQDLLIEMGNGTHSKDTPCVTIRNSLVRGVIFAEQYSHGPVLIEDTEVAVEGLSWWENVGRNNIFAYRVNSHITLDANRQPNTVVAIAASIFFIVLDSWCCPASIYRAAR